MFVLVLRHEGAVGCLNREFVSMSSAHHHPQFLCDLLGIRHPIIQAGMVWCTGADLVVAVGRAGGLGTLGAGSMYPDELRAEIARVKAAWDGPFAVNVPLLYPAVEEHMETLAGSACRSCSRVPARRANGPTTSNPQGRP